jgi:NAD(P)H-nitrite reductase large subunit
VSKDILEAMDKLDELFDEATLEQNTPQLAQTRDELICECKCVSLLEIISYYKSNNSLELEDLKRDLKLGTGCSSCTKSYKSWSKIVKNSLN